MEIMHRANGLRIIGLKRVSDQKRAKSQISVTVVNTLLYAICNIPKTEISDMTK